ncbi:MAG: MBL fold metallo-hydrolase [Chloroflexi bacterium]|nr:MBL fold metallo-hydrolase [Chloroflexota bacterium]
MFQYERVADNVYFFQSENYAQVTAGLVVGPKWVVLIDTLALPAETLALRDFIAEHIQLPVRYIINTHYHADHSWGNVFFPGAVVISHALCRQLMQSRGMPALEEAKQTSSAYRQVSLVLPQLAISEGEMSLKVGKKILRIFPMPGHSPDGMGVLVETDRILFAGDAIMPIPYIVDGDFEALQETLKQVSKMRLENIIPGHGEIVLRGEIKSTLKEDLDYLACIRKEVRKAARRKYPGDYLDKVDVEACGKSRILLGGLAPELHRRNLRALYRQLYGEAPRTSQKEKEEAPFG